MRFLKKNCLLISLISLSLSLFSCRDMISDMESISAPMKKIQSLKMVEIRDVSNRGKTGLSPYRINTYETTYILWYEVYMWAKSNGFTFVTTAEAGKTGIAGNPGIYGYLPVTTLHPGDVLVWLNALSIKNGYTPVYYLASDHSKVVTDSRDISSGTVKTTIDGAPAKDPNGNPVVVYDYSIKDYYVAASANGFRLPDLSEWQYAAQGALRTANDVNYNYAGSNVLAEVASLKKIRVPGQYKPNGLGIYDMSGNVGEFVLENYEIRFYGGHYNSSDVDICSVKRPYNLGSVFKTYPYLCGFRIAQTI